MNYVGKDTTEVAISSPGGWKARLLGDTKIILLALVIIGCTGVWVYLWAEGQRIDREARKELGSQHQVTQALVGQSIASQKAIINILEQNQKANKEDIGELTYVLTLPQSKREALKLEMPWSLRKKVNGG
jgi:hypothetical protein